jgi:DNA polymerase V
MQLYAHADADCFYVSCERVRNPRLIGKPVAVLGNQGACVIAISYEMKAAGVQVAMPIWKAKKICPEGIFIKRDFRWYGLLSHAMQDIFNQYSDQVEYYSIDESFMLFDLDFDEAKEVANNMQKHMLKATGLPISVGFARTRTLCKLASKRNKPFGTLSINEKNREAILKNTDVQTVNGIGRRLAERAHALGIQTAWDYAQMPREVIKRVFHKPGETIWYELQSHAVLGVNPAPSERKVVSRGGSIWGHYEDPAYIWGFLIRNLERFLTCLWDNSLEVAKITTVLRTSDGQEFKHTEPLPDFTSDQAPIMAALRKGFDAAYRKGHTYSRVHIVGEPVHSLNGKQLNLFTGEDLRSYKIKEIKTDINKRFGLFTLRNATSANAVDVFKDKISDFEIVDVKDKHLFS